MLSKPLIAFANTYDFNVLEDYAYGCIDNYLVSVYNSGYKKVAFITCFAADTEGDNLSQYKLSENIKQLQLVALKDYEVCEDGILIKTGEDLSKFDEAILAVCKILGELGYVGVEKCTYCGEDIDNEKEYVFFDGVKILLYCKECAKDFLATKDAVAKSKTKAKKTKGVVAAICAAFISLLVFVAVFAFAIPYDGIKSDGEVLIKSIIFTMPFSAILSVTSFLAYRIATGKKGAERVLPCGLISLIFSMIMVYFSSATLYTKLFDLSINQAMRMLGNILSAPFTDIYYRKDFLQYLLFNALTVIAVALIYSIIFEDKKKVESFIVRYGDDEKIESVEISEDTEDEQE